MCKTSICFQRNTTDDRLNNLPTFRNVKQLTITEEVDFDDLLIAVLKATPNLESLKFDNLITPCYPEYNGWKVNMVHTRCLFHNLKSVCFRQFIGKPREMRWVKLILKNAKLLQTMIISYGAKGAACLSNPKSKQELTVEIPSIPRASSSCVQVQLFS